MPLLAFSFGFDDVATLAFSLTYNILLTLAVWLSQAVRPLWPDVCKKGIQPINGCATVKGYAALCQMIAISPGHVLP